MKKYQSYNNDELLGLLSRGDEVAFTEIYERYWQKLFVIAYNRIKEIETAEDIVHDVFVSLWANREKVNIGSLENYLAVATKYTVLSKINKKERERAYEKSSSVQASVYDLPIEASLHHKHILELVRKEVEKLPEKCRLIFKYSRDEGMPIKQIANELNLSPKTVENQINKALKHLKVVMKSLPSVLLVFIQP
jgi:RNA polymerase sigma-70 factor (ECF subfamily)